MKKLIVSRDGVDLTEDGSVELRNGQANPFGWSQYEIFAKDGRDQFVHVGWLESGEPMSPAEGWAFRVEDAGP